MKTAPRLRFARLRSSSGFSLIEVMIALIVFAIGVLALAVCVPLGTRKITRAGQQTRASTLAAERAEQLLMTPYGNGDLTAGNHTDVNNPVEGIYYVQWDVSDDQPIASCKRVFIHVSRYNLTQPTEAAVTIVCPSSGG